MTTTVADIDVTFQFSSKTGTHTVAESIVATDSSLQSTIDDRAEELVDDLNDDKEGGADDWDFEEYTIDDYDTDFAGPLVGFNDLNEYGAYAEQVEEHGVAYHLRYEDVGENNFDDEYRGCWSSEEAFARDFYEECYEIPTHLECHIDWESVTRDVMMDCSSYEATDGYHIFRD